MVSLDITKGICVSRRVRRVGPRQIRPARRQFFMDSHEIPFAAHSLLVQQGIQSVSLSGPGKFWRVFGVAVRGCSSAPVASLCDNLFSSPKGSNPPSEMPMDRRIEEDVISQAELRKGAAFTTGTSAAIRLVRELYMMALVRRLADGALIEPGPLSFDCHVGVVSRKKDVDTETRGRAIKRALRRNS